MFLSFRSPNSQCPQMESRYHSQGLFFLWLRTSDIGISPCHMPHGFINSSSRLGMAAVAGACGGFVGTPGDMTNVRSESPENWKCFYFSTYSRCIARMKVSGLCLAKLIGYISRSAPTTCFKSSLFRMQNDMKLPPEQRRKYVLPISLEFIRHPILKTVQLLRNVILWRNKIQRILDLYLSKKRLSPNWQSTSSCPHTCYCYCCLKHLESRLHTSLRLIVCRACDYYVFVFFSKLLSHSYKHAIDGMARVYREEGLRNLFSGADWATGRWRLKY